MLKHKHIFKYEVEQSTVQGIVPHLFSLEITGDANLTEIVEKFEAYLIAVGYVPPENTHLDFVDSD